MTDFRSKVRVRDKNGAMKNVLAIKVKGGGEDVTYPVADQPTTMGQRACLARAAQFRDVQYQLKADMDFTSVQNNPVPSGTRITGLPYSSVRQTDRFIGFNVSLHTFMTAINNPRSVLYTTSEEENKAENGEIASVFYGTNCSTYVSYAHGWDYHNATNIISELPYLQEVDPAEMQLCDIADSSSSNGGDAGHVVLISGLTRDENGTILTVEISHSWPVWVRKETMTFDQFVQDYIVAHGYHVYRNTRLEECGYTPSPFVKGYDEETLSDIEYSRLCTNRGDKVTITQDEEIVLNVLLDGGYETIKLLRNGNLFGEYTVENGDIVSGDVRLVDLPSGLYTASLYDARGTAIENASTFFEVCEVSVTQTGKRFEFAGDGAPCRIVYKNGSGYTQAVFELNEDDAARGYKILDNVGVIPAQVCVPFKTTYGFVVARCEYDDTGVTEVDLPDDFQKVEYIASNGTQYIDTGVVPSAYAGGISYTWTGSIDDASSTTSRYIFGCLNDNKRSGNLCYYAGGSGQLVDFYVGASSWSKQTTFGKTNTPLAERDKITFRCFATSTDNSTVAASYNTTAFPLENGTFSPCAMPSATIHLMACNGISGDTRLHKGETMAFVMAMADGTPIRNFVPCYRKADGEIGLYDTVGGVFYENSGTGTFTKGADV